MSDVKKQLAKGFKDVSKLYSYLEDLCVNKDTTFIMYHNGDDYCIPDIVATLLGGSGMTKDEVILAVGGVIFDESEDENVCINGNLYYYDDLHIL
nr:unnamed protein product [uncultured bacterium]